ncbi:variant erythrocyte surface antigen-1 family protein [Babesia caballi]|uniref:Variant erythrocyte surface antigen-1 family protein n=1 Tax=Babesia caballi TaxID=5871 RepID=A0AAV4LNM2_BABCB|nr:variant erythrocyte surface antigen-1 family protein [Babesia caballi]
MGVPKTQLTDWPEDLKDVIDWLALVGGGFGGKSWDVSGKPEKLETALMQLDGFDTTAFPNHEFGGLTLSEIIRIFARGLGSGFLGYDGVNRGELNGKGILDSPGHYKSTYHDAKWEDNDEHIYAKTFLFLACLVFYIITFLYWMCKTSDKWKGITINSSGPFKELLTAMGYDQSQLDQQKNGDTIADRLTGMPDGSNAGFPDLQAAYQGEGASSYKNFLNKLGSKIAGSPLNHPLASCKTVSYAYLQSRRHGADITAAIGAIKKELVNLSERFSSYASVNNDFYALQQKIKTLLDKIQSFDPNLVSSSLTCPIITGGGILPANVAKYQVGNAVLNFVIRFLDGLSKVNEASYKKDVLKVVGTLRKCVGTGQVPKGFETLVEGIGKKVQTDLNGLQVNAGLKVKEVFDKLKILVDTARFTNLGDVQFNDVETFLGDVFRKVKGEDPRTHLSNFNTVCTQLISLFNQRNIKNDLNDQHPVNGGLKPHVNAVSRVANHNALHGDISRSRTDKPFTAALLSTLQGAANSVVGDLTTKTYKSYYYDANKREWSDNNNINGDHAKIFLTCLPLYFHVLTYIYWSCNSSSGGWMASRGLTSGGRLNAMMESQGFYNKYVNGGRLWKDVVEIMGERFKELSVAMTANQQASSPSPPSRAYIHFTKNLREKVNGSSGSYTDCSLSALYYCATCYFRCEQKKNAGTTTKPPSSIREMLYWLSGLQFSPSYDAFDTYLTDHFKTLIFRTTSQSGPDSRQDHELALEVADSATTSKTNKLSAGDLKEYLATTCLFIPTVLYRLQSRDASTRTNPLLHELHTNSMGFTYQSASSLLSKLAEYAYALQFQLHFLHQQCKYTNNVGRGWWACTFGRDVNTNVQGGAVESWICATQCTKTDHSDPRKHATGCEHKHCGDIAKGGKPSPLQAFLTDNLTGFSRGYPSDPSSHLSTCSGTVCHVPMGFANKLRQGSGATGYHIHHALSPLCGEVSSPLRQLSEKLSCLTKRTPRTLGDLFGFTWHLTGQLFSDVKIQAKDPSGFLPTAFTKLLEKLSTVKSGLLYDSLTAHVKTIGSALFGVSWHCHRKNKWKTEGRNVASYCKDHNNSTVCDLASLHNSECTGKSCGQYLEPLAYSDGATFANSFASMYLSCAVYLADDLYESLDGFKTQFEHLKCSYCGNVCQTNPNCHSRSSVECQCDSVVQCAGLHPLLYDHGFTFNDAKKLFGWTNVGTRQGWVPNGANQRKCSQFHSQLQTVINGEPLYTLLIAVDGFLYAIRWGFFSKLSAFWTIYIGLILYTFFFLLDTLHVRSHLKLTSSHMVPPLALLTQGTPIPITKLTYIG